MRYNGITAFDLIPGQFKKRGRPVNRYFAVMFGMLLGLFGAPRATLATPFYRVTDLGTANWGDELSLDNQDHVSSFEIFGPNLGIPQFICVGNFEGRDYTSSAVQYGEPVRTRGGLASSPISGGGGSYEGSIYGFNQADDALLGSSAGGDAFLALDGSVLDLNSLISSDGWWLQRADSLNSEGQIVGIGIDPEGQRHIFCLRPYR